VRDGKDNYRLLSYDSLDRLKKIEFTGANTTLDVTEPYVSYTYNRDGDLTSETTREQGTGTVRTRTMTYDKLGRLLTEDLPGGSSPDQTYAYDLVGNLISFADSGGAVEYTYDELNRARSIYEPDATKPTKFQYNDDGQRTLTTYPNDVKVKQDYDDAQRLTAITSYKTDVNSPLEKFTYGYRQPTTNRQTPLIFEKTDGVLNQTTRYAYDALDRLDTATILSSTNSPLAAYDYDLDAAGNVVKRTVTGPAAPASTTNYAYNAANELCDRKTASATAGCTAATYGYDRNANQTATPQRTAAYDLADRTSALTVNATATSMIYLGAGQDRWSAEGNAGLQHNVLGISRRNVGFAVAYFVRDDQGKLVSSRVGSTRAYYLFDALGSITATTDSSGTLTARFDYEPYGTPAPSLSGQWGYVAGIAADVPPGQFGFAAGYRSVAGLYHFGQRYYDPADMRWTQPDPLDQTGDLRQGNRYLYAGADPVNVVDLRGTDIGDTLGDAADAVGSAAEDTVSFVKRNAGKAASITSNLGSASAAYLAVRLGAGACFAGATAGGPVGWTAGYLSCSVFVVGSAGVAGYELYDAYKTARSIR